jgi:hypothetical protein
MGRIRALCVAVIKRDPGFPNQITLRSMEDVLGYEPGWYAPDISPTPLLMVVACDDVVTPSAAALKVSRPPPSPRN